MISLVVCSANEKMFQQLNENIQATIGVAYEIIRINNSKNQYNICQAYNIGAARANYDILCFVHEDVLFVENSWGKVLTEMFKDPATGLVGIAGTCYYSLFPIGWFNLSEAESNLIQGYKYSNKPPTRENYSRFSGSADGEVVVIDGVFMATKKEIAKKHPFDEKLLIGFHGYDADFSLQVGQHFKVVVSKNILLTHLSEGKDEKEWHTSMKKISKKWAEHLPVYIDLYSSKELRDLTIESLSIYCNTSKNWLSFAGKNLAALYHATKHGVLLLWLRKIILYIAKKFKKKDIKILLLILSLQNLASAVMIIKYNFNSFF